MKIFDDCSTVPLSVWLRSPAATRLYWTVAKAWRQYKAEGVADIPGAVAAVKVLQEIVIATPSDTNLYKVAQTLQTEIQEYIAWHPAA